MLETFQDYAVVASLEQQETRSTYLVQALDQQDKHVVMSIFHQPALIDQEQQEKFLQESKILSRLRHPHLVSILDSGIEQQRAYIISEHCARGSLRTHLEQIAPELLPLRRAMTMVQQIGQTLAYLHAQGTVHGQLRPEQLFFDEDGQMRVASWYRPNHTELSLQKLSANALRYLAPEQFQNASGPLDATPLSDQYTLCCIAYEVLTGQTPFPTNDRAALQEIIVSVAPASLRKRRVKLPIHIDEAVLRGLEKDPARRYPDINAFLAAFQTMIDIPSFPLPRNKRKQTGSTSAPSWPPVNQQPGQTEPISVLPSSLPIPEPAATMEPVSQSSLGAVSGKGEDEIEVVQKEDEISQREPAIPAPLSGEVERAVPVALPSEEPPVRIARLEVKKGAGEKTLITSKAANAVTPPSTKKASNMSRGTFASVGQLGHVPATGGRRPHPTQGKNFSFAPRRPGKVAWTLTLGFSVVCVVTYGILTVNRPTITFAQVASTPIIKQVTPNPHDLLPAVIATPTSNLKPTPTPRSHPKPKSGSHPVVPTPTPVQVAATPPTQAPATPPSVQVVPTPAPTTPAPRPTPTSAPVILNQSMHVESHSTDAMVTSTFGGLTISNVRINAELTTQGDSGGILFRSTYRFHVGTDGSYYLENASATVTSGSSPAIKTGSGATNNVTIVAVGSHITISVNGTTLVNVMDSTSSSGSLGAFAWDTGHDTIVDCNFYVVAD